MKKKSFFSMVAYMIGLTFKSVPVYSAILIILTIASGLVPVFQIGVTANFINLAIKSFNEGHILNEIYSAILLIMLLIGYTWLSGNISNAIQTKIRLQIQGNLRSIIIEKCAKLKFSYIEDSQTWDLILRISSEPEKKILDGYNSILALLVTIVNFCGVLIYIVAQVWWAAILILVFCIPLFYFSVKSGKVTYDAERQLLNLQRRYNYLSEVLVGRDSVDERTMFQYSSYINESYKESYNKYYKEIVKVSIGWVTKTKLGGLLTTFASLIIVSTLLKPTISGQESVGMFISIVNAVFAMSNQLTWQLSTQMDNIVSTKEFMSDIDVFFSLDETPDVLGVPAVKQKVNTIEFIDVCFRYPNTDNYILKNLSLKLESGKHYSFVGSNGAGKTTVVKLLTGLYSDYTGKILINNRDIRDYTQSEIKGLFSTVYQDLAKYSFSVKENCIIGNINEIDNQDCNKIISESLEMVELSDTVKTLPQGINTLLGKIHSDGIDLSGGQWQRIALARSFINNAPVRILDEPTASLDPISESKLYELFDKISSKTLTILISHRLASTKIADSILVFEDGQIVEQGTHDELMAIRNIYYNMFEQQRGWYQ